MQVNFGNLILLFGVVLTLFDCGLCRQKIGQKCSRDYHCESRNCAQSYCVSGKNKMQFRYNDTNTVKSLLRAAALILFGHLDCGSNSRAAVN